MGILAGLARTIRKIATMINSTSHDAFNSISLSDFNGDKMVQLGGQILFAMGFGHGVMSFVLFGDLLKEIWAAGIGAGSSWSLDMMAAFWFAIFTWLMVVLGLVIAEVGKSGYLPYRRAIGWSFIVVPTLCGVFLPISGLWALMIPGIFILLGRDGPTRL